MTIKCKSLSIKKHPSTIKIISAAQTYRRTVKNHFMFNSQHMQRKIPPKKSKSTFCITHNYSSSVGNVPSVNVCTHTRAIRAALLFVPCVFVSQLSKLFMILGIFWGKYIPKPLNRKTELELKQAVLNVGYEEEKNDIWKQSEKWVHVFGWEKAMKHKSINMEKRKREREREAGGSGRAMV